MTKAVILEQHGAGEYTIQVEDDTTRAQAQVDSIAQRLPNVELELLQAQVAVLDAEAALDQASNALDIAIAEVIADPDALISDDPRIEAGVQGVQQASINLWQVRRREANIQATRASLATQKTAIENSIAASTRSPFRTFCADYTEDLPIDSAVAMCLVPGEDVGYVWTIRPGYEDKAVWSYAVNGQLTPVWSVTPESCFYNLAMLPGWQRWLPTYRFGLITEIHDDGTADVLLDDARSSQKNLTSNTRFNVNELLGQPTVLENVPIKYMYCHWQAFDIDDHVVLEFEQKESGSLSTLGFGFPTIIGFVENPKICLSFHEIGLADYHRLALDLDPSAYLYYPESVRNLIAPYGGAPGELVEAAPPLWLDYNGTVGGVLGTEFRFYVPGMRSLAVTEQGGNAITRANQFIDQKDYKHLAQTRKLKFVISAAMSLRNGGFTWLDPYCLKPVLGRTFAIHTHIIYPSEATSGLPETLEYWLMYIPNNLPIAFYKLEYDEKNPVIIEARTAFFALGRATPTDTESVKFERLRAESIICGSIPAPDWDEVRPAPDYETPLPFLVPGNTADYGVHVAWNGDRVAVVTRQKVYDGFDRVLHYQSWLTTGTIRKNSAAQLDGNIQFDVVWTTGEAVLNTPANFEDNLFIYNPEKVLDQFIPWVDFGETGAYQAIAEPAAPVYCFYDSDDRLNIVRHFRQISTTFEPTPPPEWNTYREDAFTCTPLDGIAAFNDVYWLNKPGQNFHGFWCEREATPGQQDYEEIWRHVAFNADQSSNYRYESCSVYANNFQRFEEGWDSANELWNDPVWSCDPRPAPGQPAVGYLQTRVQGNGISELRDELSEQIYYSYLLLPGFDSSSVISGYRSDNDDFIFTHRRQFQGAACAIEDTPGNPPVYPPTGDTIQWRLDGAFNNFRFDSGTGGIVLLQNAPRWRSDCRMILTGKTESPFITSEVSVWINETGDNEPETTGHLPPGGDPTEARNQALGRWIQFSSVSLTDKEIIPFRVKYGNNDAGYYDGDFNAPTPEETQGRTDAGLPWLSHWDFVWIGSA